MTDHEPHMRHLNDATAADVALRCAWLRVHAAYTLTLDPSAQLCVQLLDFADLLEVAIGRGWLDREAA